MSFAAVGAAVSLKTDNSAQKLILLLIASYADEHGECFPSQQTLGEEASMSTDSVSRALKELEASGFISRERRSRDNGSRTSDKLTLIHPDLTRNLRPRDNEPNPQIAGGGKGSKPANNGTLTRKNGGTRTYHLPYEDLEESTPPKVLDPAHSGLGPKNRKPETPIPADFPPLEMRKASADEVRAAGIRIDVRAQALALRTWAESNDIRKRDWPATWNGWIRRKIIEEQAKAGVQPDVPRDVDAQAPPGFDPADLAICKADVRTLSSPAEQQAYVAHRKMMDFTRWSIDQREGRWTGNGADWGPPPGTAGCRIPPEIQRAHGVEPWNP